MLVSVLFFNIKVSISILLDTIISIVIFLFNGGVSLFCSFYPNIIMRSNDPNPLTPLLSLPSIKTRRGGGRGLKNIFPQVRLVAYRLPTVLVFLIFLFFMSLAHDSFSSHTVALL